MPNSKNQTTLIIAAVVMVVAVLGAALAYQLNSDKDGTSNNGDPKVKVSDFIECEAAGYQVMESYPRQCRDAEGNVYVEKIADDNDSNESPSQGLNYTVLGQGTGMTSTLPEGETVLGIKSTQADFQSLWNKAYPDASTRPSMPFIDFANSQIVAISKQASSSGYKLEVTSVSSDSGVINLLYSKPGEGCINSTVITNPFVIIRIDGGASQFKYNYSVKTVDCTDK
ncbi:MAG: hypothetical protein Fur003_2620 [Candidatus Dojkabacteria bacterium]